MQYHWINKKNNDKLIIFFAGWSFDFRPFEFLNCENFDVLFIYDYNEINTLPDIGQYRQKYLIAWSMGVFTAYQLKKELPDFDKKIAINGTAFPVNDTLGIPKKPFLLTLKHAKIGLEGKFYQNIFFTNAEYEKYLNTPIERTIENRENELKALYARIEKTENKYENFYDFALISNYDKIIPTQNQINFWQTNAQYKLLESGHFPFYNFKSWSEILNTAE